ncbi:hypothetical protein ACFRH9_17265 [Peribacillus butanolivorans]|uniref:hypothetical protein n=1 Tax=Peribacillus butanolivorans TaxID=421767 RepID=UPI003672B6B3
MVKKVNKKMDAKEIDELRKIVGVDEANKDNYIYVEGAGIVWETGKLNLEGLIKRLLQSEYITGNKND